MLSSSGDQNLMSVCPVIDDINSDHLVKIASTRFLICSKFTNFPFVIIVITCSSSNLYPIILAKLMIFASFSCSQDHCKFRRLCQFHPSIFLLLAGILHPLSLHVCGYLSMFACGFVCQCRLTDSHYFSGLRSITVLIYSDVQIVPGLVRGNTFMLAPIF